MTINPKESCAQLKSKIIECTSYLSKKNKGCKALHYFYKRAREFYDKKKAWSGRKVIGTLCNFVPVELIRAAGAIPVRLCAGFGENIDIAEKTLPRLYCPLVKSTYTLLLQNNVLFKIVDAVISPTSCDCKKKLAELCALHKKTYVLEVPHTSITPQSRELWLASLNSLKTDLEKLTGTRISSKKLKESIDIYNRMHSLVHRLYDIRKNHPPPIWGGDALIVTNTAFFDDPMQWSNAVEALCKELENNTHRHVCDTNSPRIFLTGTPVILPAWKIVNVIEDAGGIIVCDDICTGFKPFFDPIIPTHSTLTDMLIAIADKYLMHTCACFVPNTARIERLLKLVENFKIDGVVYYRLHCCHTYGAEEWRIRSALKAVNIPVLSIETDYSEGDIGQLKTRLEAFIEMLKARKE